MTAVCLLCLSMLVLWLLLCCTAAVALHTSVTHKCAWQRRLCRMTGERQKQGRCQANYFDRHLDLLCIWWPVYLCVSSCTVAVALHPTATKQCARQRGLCSMTEQRDRTQIYQSCTESTEEARLVAVCFACFCLLTLLCCTAVVVMHPAVTRRIHSNGGSA